LRGVKYYRNGGRAIPAHWEAELRDSPLPGVVRDVVKQMGVL
jgi:hypothetical protein